MNSFRSPYLSCAAALLAVTGFAVSIVPTHLFAQAPGTPPLSANVHTFVSGLNGPRGLKFGPDGLLYVAEAGTGGSTSTGSACAQVVPPIGPYTGGSTSQISRFDRNGNKTVIATGFPSTQDSENPPAVQGLADLAFLNGSLYAVSAGGGCSHGNTTPNGIFKVNVAKGTWSQIADLSAFVAAHPAKYPDAGDFEPDGVFYSMIAEGGRLYTVEPNHGQVISVGPGGDTKLEIDVSASQGHIVPTSIASRNGLFYLGNLNIFPVFPTGARVLTLSQTDPLGGFLSGLLGIPDPGTLKITGSRAGFTTIVGLAFGPDDLLYVLEFSHTAGFPTPGFGDVVRIERNGTITTVASGLTVPTAMTFGPDGKLYVSNLGAAGPGAGQIVRVDVP